MHFYCLFVSRTASHFLIIEKTNKVLKKKKLQKMNRMFIGLLLLSLAWEASGKRRFSSDSF